MTVTSIDNQSGFITETRKKLLMQGSTFTLFYIIRQLCGFSFSCGDMRDWNVHFIVWPVVHACRCLDSNRIVTSQYFLRVKWSLRRNHTKKCVIYLHSFEVCFVPHSVGKTKVTGNGMTAGPFRTRRCPIQYTSNSHTRIQPRKTIYSAGYPTKS
jgi:hypothetical protein